MCHFFSVVIFTLILNHSTSVLEASETSRQQYLELIKDFPNVIQPQGNAAHGEIEIIIDKIKMAAIEKTTGRDVGIIAQDRFWIWINDACLFPNGREGVYGRILWVKSLESSPGVVVMPVMQDGSILLNCNFRHATRSWEIELPRGCIEIGEDLIAAAKRETMEETGMIIDSLSFLGEIPPDSGLTNTVVSIFAANVVRKEEAKKEESEAIEEILALSLDEIKQAFLSGYHDCKIRGTEMRIAFRDPFLAYAIIMYDLKKQSSCKNR
jgi:ADP-ribose diphosphatase